MYDKDGSVKVGKEVLVVWKSYFESILNESEEVGRQFVSGEEMLTEPEGVLTEDFTMDEVRQALGSLKQRAAPGRDGLTAEMISREGLVEFWWVLFNWSWRNGMVPSEWRRGVMVPVPKKKSRGTDACTPDDFRGISVVSAAYKAMCKIVQVRLEEFVERQQLLAEEQGGFRKGRGCRDQMVTLHLLGQIRMITKKKGMFASFIDLSKAYDRVGRTKLWRCLVEKGLSGRMIDFLKAAYLGIRCEVKVGDEFSDLFEVTTGLRQGCILSPLLFSLYINSFVDCLKEAGVGVECSGQRIAALLYADDMVLFADDEDAMCRSLRILQEWCEQWAIKVNVKKCGVMHIRRKGVKKTLKEFYVDGERIDVVEKYKYLGCTVNEHLECKGMIEERAMAGTRALSSWLRSCRAMVREVRGTTFRKLMEALVETVLLYGAEVWGGSRILEPVEQVQMRAARIFLGVGRLHPRVSLQFEMQMVPLSFEAKKRCIEFWVKVMRMESNRLVKMVMLEAMGLRGKVKWIEKLKQSLEEIGWMGVGMEELGKLSNGEVVQMLRDCVWRAVKESWAVQAEQHSKLKVVKELRKIRCEATCIDVESKGIRRMLTKLRGGTAELRVETGRWSGLRREERICKQCALGEVEDEAHFVLRCEALSEERRNLLRHMELVDGWQDEKEGAKLAMILEQACIDQGVGRELERMWRSRFEKRPAPQSPSEL